MKKDTLINLFDIHNESILVAIDIYSPKKVISIVEKKDYELYKAFEDKCKNIFNNIIYESIIIELNNIYEIENIFSKISNSCIINITGGKKIISLIILKLSIDKKLPVVYVDIVNKCIYIIEKDIKKENIKFKDFFLKDILAASGSEIIDDSKELSSDNKIINIAEKIYDNLNIWNQYKYKLYDKSLIIHNYEENNISIKLELLNENEINILMKCLQYLQQYKMIKYYEDDSNIKVKFLNEYIKGFIFKSGTWLEVLVSSIVNEIREIDQTANGVIFLWKERERVKNELDVIAVKDSVVICISCKDSDKYDEDALNELKVYSDRIAGENTKKILVATKEPCKRCVIERAKAMNINLIIANNNKDKLKNDLVKIINAEEKN